MGLEEKIRPFLPIEVGPFYVNYGTAFNSAVVVLIIALSFYWLTRKIGKYPDRKQVLVEFFVGAFDTMILQSMGRRFARLFLPVFGSLFLYILFSNFLGLVPVSALTWGAFPEEGIELSDEALLVDLNDNGIWDPGEPFRDENANGVRDAFFIPAWEEPTKDVNMTLGVALWMAALMYLSVITFRGPLHIVKDLADPMWFMFPLNVVGKGAEVVSVSFRLFGNIFGGSVLIAVMYDILMQYFFQVGVLAQLLLVPIVATAFLVLFVGMVQAFVYTVLWMTYTTNSLGAEGE